MQWRGSTNKSPTKLNAAKINLTQVICLRMGKTTEAKFYRMNLRSPSPKNLLLSKQAVTSKRISILYTNLQLNPYPNT